MGQPDLTRAIVMVSEDPRFGVPARGHRAELLAILPHDRRRRFEPDADRAVLINERALGGNSLDEILGGQYRRHPATHSEVCRTTPSIGPGLGQIGLEVLRHTLGISVEERLQRQDPCGPYRLFPRRSINSDCEMDVGDAH
jgi:hypothetical protein